MTTPVQPDQLRISIEMGDDYQPSDRLGAALGELAAALADEESDGEVEGFYYRYELTNFSALSYDSLAPAGEGRRLDPQGPPEFDRARTGKSGLGVFKF